MANLVDWIGNLSTGILASIIATIICSFFIVGAIVVRVKRKSRLNISHSDIGGDIIAGDKRANQRSEQISVKDNRSTITSIKKTKVKGDVVQGDKEG